VTGPLCYANIETMTLSKIDERLYQGGQMLKLPSQINAVINLRYEHQEHFPDGQVLAYAWFPIWDELKYPGDEWLSMVADTIATFYGNPKLHVLVHCAAGISRASMAMASFLIRHRRMSYEEAMNYICRHRPEACPNPSFVEGLKAYSKRLVGC
jgi:protein-tyrosine phosphatase